MFKDGELEEKYWKYNGPKDEGTFGFVKRAWSSISNKLQMKRMDYDASSLSEGYMYGGEDVHFTELIVPMQAQQFERIAEVNIALGFWDDTPLHLQSISSSSSAQNKMCILYIHTNTRSLADALELLPLCEALDASLLAFDLPGCGKSQGFITIPDCRVIQSVLEYALATFRPREVVLWSRGSASASVLGFLSNSTLVKSLRVVCAVLDSPFTGMRDVICNMLKKIGDNTKYVPSFMFSLYVRYVRKKIQEVLHVDPFLIDSRPILGMIKTPCMIMSAKGDDFIPVDHGKEVFMALACASNSSYRTFAGGHFDKRPSLLVLNSMDFIQQQSLNRSKFNPLIHSPRTSVGTSSAVQIAAVKINSVSQSAASTFSPSHSAQSPSHSPSPLSPRICKSKDGSLALSEYFISQQTKVE